MKIEVNCAQCDSIILKEKSQVHDRNFCNRDCKNKYFTGKPNNKTSIALKGKLVGENNPNFGKKWNSEQKEKASFNSKGKVRAIDLKTGQKIIIDKVLFENNDRYDGLTKGKCVLMNLKTGEKFHGSSDLIDGVNIVAESKGRKHKPKYFIEIYKDEKLLYALKDNIEEHCKQYNFSFRFILSRSRLGEIIKFGNNSAKERATKSGNIIFEGCRIIRVSIKD